MGTNDAGRDGFDDEAVWRPVSATDVRALVRAYRRAQRMAAFVRYALAVLDVRLTAAQVVASIDAHGRPCVRLVLNEHDKHALAAAMTSDRSPPRDRDGGAA